MSLRFELLVKQNKQSEHDTFGRGKFLEVFLRLSDIL